MGETTAIEWCHHTFNPWWGCRKVSDGCRNCYAATMADRFGEASLWLGGHRRTTAAWSEPRRWNRAAIAANERRRVFCASMADVFESPAELDPWRADLWPLIGECAGLDWLLLTKRPENIRRMVPAAWLDRWPDHVWIGTSVEDQRAADTRIPRLLDVPARVRFLSMEPLLGPVDLSAWHESEPYTVQCSGCETWVDEWGNEYGDCSGHEAERLRSRISWVIVGGESGHHARPMHPEWARSVRDQCAAAGVPFFFKQWGEWGVEPGAPPIGYAVPYDPQPMHHEWPDHARVWRVGKKAAGRVLDGKIHDEFPEVLHVRS